MSAAAKLAQELITKEIKLPKELARVSVVYHCASHSNKPFRNLTKYRFNSLAGANPHVSFQKIVYNKNVVYPSQDSNNNFITLEMIDGTQKRVTVKKKEIDADRVVQKMLEESQALVGSIDVSLARLLQEHENRMAIAKLSLSAE